MTKIDSDKKLVLIITAVWSVISLIFSIFFFTAPDRASRAVWAVIAYILAVLFIYFFVSLVVNAVKYDGEARQLILLSLPFLIILFSCILKSRITAEFNEYYSGDVLNIRNAAVKFNPGLFVYTSLMYIISFYILPFEISPFIIKLISTSLILGYVVFRTKKYYKSNLVYLIYGLAFLKPVCEYAVDLHRMHWYAFIYLFFMVKIFFDCKEKKEFSYHTVVLMSVISGFLSVWRREGMYLFIFGAILLLITYGRENGVITKNNLIRILIIFAVCEFVICFPALKKGMGEKLTTSKALFVHMMGEKSLDRDKISEELAIADQFYDLEKVDLYNEASGWDGFDDCYYDWADFHDGVVYCMRENPTVTPEEFTDAVIHMILKEPGVFIKSRLKAFYAADVLYEGYGLFLPLVLVLSLFIYSIIKKEWALFVSSMCALGPAAITAMTMPASKNRYFLEMVLFGYFFAAIILTDIMSKVLDKKENQEGIEIHESKSEENN